MDTKPFWTSKTLWGSVSVILGLVLPGMGISASPSEIGHATDSIANILDDALTVFGIFMTIYGRFKAVKPVSLTGAKAVIAIAIGVGLLFGVSSARAADVAPVFPVKIPQAPPANCTLTDCSGPYIGINIQQTGANFDIIGGGLNGLGQNNFALGGQFGYEFYNGQWRLGVEAGADYGLVQNGTLPGGGNHGLWSAYQLACVGYSLNGLFGGSATNTSAAPTPSLPQSLASALMSPCILVGGWERPWGAGIATGARASALLAKGWTLDVDYLHVNYNNANVNPNVSEQTENMVRGGISYHFNWAK